MPLPEKALAVGGKAGDQGRGATGCLGTSCMLRFSCYQYHVTKQSVMKLLTPSCLQSFFLAVLTGPFVFCPECLVGHGQCPMELQCLMIKRLTISDGLLLNGFVHWFSRLSTTESTSPLSLQICDGCKPAWLTQELCSSIISRSIDRWN